MVALHGDVGNDIGAKQAPGRIDGALIQRIGHGQMHLVPFPLERNEAVFGKMTQIHPVQQGAVDNRRIGFLIGKTQVNRKHLCQILFRQIVTADQHLTQPGPFRVGFLFIQSHVELFFGDITQFDQQGTDANTMSVLQKRSPYLLLIDIAEFLEDFQQAQRGFPTGFALFARVRPARRSPARHRSGTGRFH